MNRRLLLTLTLAAPVASRAADADLILHNGKVIAVDAKFAVHQALAVTAGKVALAGTDADVLKLRGERTEVIDLKGRTVLPGLIDSHVHPAAAAMTEFDHAIPDMELIADVLAYVKGRAKIVPEGQWIVLRQVFITRLKEQRYPTRQELDEAAPKHPVLFATNPDASLNTLALKRSKIDKDFKVTDGGAGFAEKDAKTGEPTGILRSCTRYVDVGEAAGRRPTEADHLDRLTQLFADYNSVGLTAVVDRAASPEDLARFAKLRDKGRLTVRIAASHSLATSGTVESIRAKVKEIAAHPLVKGDAMLRVIGTKIFLDGGMLTGSAYMREPWGVSKIYSIDDPKYLGVLFVSPDKLTEIVRAVVEANLQFTAHSVGDGAVHALLDAYREVDKATPIRKTRPCLTHANFMSKEAVESLPKLGVCVDVQPAWLYLDSRTLVNHFGYDRLRYFQPLSSIFVAGGIVGGGSDHMQKIGAGRAINPYDPWLGMATAITRTARWYDGQVHPEEALTREQAIRLYTTNNAFIAFLDDKVGTLEVGKDADFIVVDRDPLTCPADDIRGMKVVRTYLGGKPVYVAK